MIHITVIAIGLIIGTTWIAIDDARTYKKEKEKEKKKWLPQAY